MPVPSIYLNLEDDVNKIIQRIKRERFNTVVLVCPKRCFLFSDSINLRLLKKQTDLLGKEVFILTMDELGQMYAREAGFKLKFLPKATGHAGMGDVRRVQSVQESEDQADEKSIPEQLATTVSTAVAGIKNLVHTPKVAVTDSFYPDVVDQQLHKKNKNQHRAYKKMAISFLAVCLILVLLLVFVILPKATVAVYAKTDPLTRDWDISMSTAIQSPDAVNLALPATAISQTFDENNKFSSQGKQEVGNKASGTVQIYNFTKLPLNLKAGTTLLTLGSNNYVLSQDLTGIRPTTYINAVTKEVNAGSLTPPIEVTAQQGGDQYNVPAGTRLEISNQVFGSRPQLLFAKTVEPITGGTSRFLSVITDADLTAAQNSLADQALQDLKSQLAGKNLVLADKSYTLNNAVFTPDQPSGTQTPTINADLKVKVTGLAFSMPDLQKLIVDRINQTLAVNEAVKISSPAQEITYSIKNLDLNASTATLSVHFEGNAVMNVNLPDLASELVGKKLSQARELLLSNSAIDKVDITLAPSWQKSFPLFAGKIKVATMPVGQ